MLWKEYVMGMLYASSAATFLVCVEYCIRVDFSLRFEFFGCSCTE